MASVCSILLDEHVGTHTQSNRNYIHQPFSRKLSLVLQLFQTHLKVTKPYEVELLSNL